MIVWGNFYFQYYSGLYTMQEPSHLGKFALISIWFKMVLTQMFTWVYKDSLTWRYTPNIDIWLVSQFWYPRVGSLIPYLSWLLIPIHSPIYRSNIGTYLSNTNTESERFSPLVAAIKLHAILKPSRVMSLLKIQHPIQFSANAILLFPTQKYNW